MHLITGDATKLPFQDDFFDLVIGSPSYGNARTYNRSDIARKTREWVNFAEAFTHEGLRVSKGPVLWVVAGTGGSEYEPLPELLVAAMYGKCCILRPNIWVKNAPPTGKTWFSNDWEYVLAFAKEVPLKTWNPQEIATPLKYKAGGNFRQRKRDGERSEGGSYPQHEMRKRPSNVHYVTVGGGHMGWPEATKVNEAPFPEALVSRFIRVLTNPGDKVLDPFSGSGTTAATAEMLGRIGYGVDIREEQTQQASRRQEYVNAHLLQPATT
jgi:hypothetical protein